LKFSAVIGGVVVPVDGVVVVGTIGDSVCVDVAAMGVAVGVGVTAGVLASGELVTENAPVVADELAFGSDAGTTVPVWVDVLQRPWHTVEVEPKVELPVTAAGLPFRLGVVVLVWALPWLSSLPDVGVVVVDVVVVAVVVGLVV
jgi:hypothetical protein